MGDKKMITKKAKILVKGLQLRPMFEKENHFQKHGFIVAVDTDKKTVKIKIDKDTFYQENFKIPSKNLKRLAKKKYIIILTP